MSDLLEIGLSPPVACMEAQLEPYKTWIESVAGCAMAETLTLELEFPFGQLAAENALDGVALDRQCLEAAGAIRSIVSRWQLPPGVSPRIEMTPGRERGSSLTPRKRAWDPHWKETPIAVWFRDLEHAVVSANIPYVSYIERTSNWRQWVIVNRKEAAAVLNLLRGVESPRRIVSPGGQDLPLDQNGYNWDSVVLDPCLNRLVRDDFEAFFQREEWFRARGLPYRRGYLLYGPPGNGKTAVARIMACHPDVDAFTIDFCNDELPNEALTHLFQVAGNHAPSLIIMEDLDRVSWQNDGGPLRPRITLQHLLGCLDGFGSRDGVVVVATANDPARLDPAILRRPGRFDRLAPFPPPSLPLRRIYLERLTGGALDTAAIAEAATHADRLSFAQIREAYILAGQMTFARAGQIGLDDLLAGLRRVRSEASEFLVMATAREVGFGAAGDPATAEVRPRVPS